MIRDALSLAKVSISILVALTALLGFFLNGIQSRFDLFAAVALLCFAGTFLLSAGAGILNNIQDRVRDRGMRRTCMRPLARGAVGVRAAAIACVACLAAGAGLLLALGRGPWPAAWGLLAVALYNGAYTPLKTRSLWGLVAGAVAGALPVLIGWHASLAIAPAPAQSVLQVACVFLLLFVWQMPHFWLLMLHHRDDYAALPGFVALRSFGAARLKIVTMAWVACFAVLLLLVPLTGAVDSRAAAWVLTVAAAAVLAIFLHGLFGASGGIRPIRLFVGLNLCVCLLMAVVAADKILLRLFLLRPWA